MYELRVGLAISIGLAGIGLMFLGLPGSIITSLAGTDAETDIDATLADVSIIGVFDNPSFLSPMNLTYLTKCHHA